MTPQTLEQMDLEAAVLYIDKILPGETSEFSGEGVFRYSDLEEAVLYGIKHERERVKLSEEERLLVAFVNDVRCDVSHNEVNGLLAIIERITGMEAGK